MSSGSGKKVKKNSSSSSCLESEVDQLLKAAEDHVLLNLKLNSHTKSSNTTTHNLLSSVSPSSSPYLDPDLTLRFEALKSTPAKPQPADADDLSARFNALKSSLGHQEVLLDSSSKNQESSDDDVEDDDSGDGVSKKEVEKLMQWAMDAARLDSVSKTEDEIEDEDKDDEVDDEDSEEEEEKMKMKDGNCKGKGKPKKWYFF